MTVTSTVGTSPEGLLEQLTEALSGRLSAGPGCRVRVELETALAFRDNAMVTVTRAEVSVQVEGAKGRKAWKRVGMPLCPPEGEGRREMLELLAGLLEASS